MEGAHQRPFYGQEVAFFISITLLRISFLKILFNFVTMNKSYCVIVREFLLEMVRY